MSTQNQLHRRVPASAQTITEDTTTTTTTTTLRLRGAEEDEQHDDDDGVQRSAPRRRIRWDESVVNNESMGRKSSKG